MYNFFNQADSSNHSLGALYLKNLFKLNRVPENDPEYEDFVILDRCMMGEIIERFLVQYCKKEYDEFLLEMEDLKWLNRRE